MSKVGLKLLIYRVLWYVSCITAGMFIAAYWTGVPTTMPLAPIILNSSNGYEIHSLAPPSELKPFDKADFKGEWKRLWL